MLSASCDVVERWLGPTEVIAAVTVAPTVVFGANDAASSASVLGPPLPHPFATRTPVELYGLSQRRHAFRFPVNGVACVLRTSMLSTLWGVVGELF
jgi:hypothetical protein